MTSAENGDIENVTLALTSGANVNVHHYEKVSILSKYCFVLVFTFRSIIFYNKGHQHRHSRDLALPSLVGIASSKRQFNLIFTYYHTHN